MFRLCLLVLALQVLRQEVLAITNDINDLPDLERLEQRTMRAEAALAQLRAFLLPPVCPKPWRAFAGMCLTFRKLPLTWPEAELFCSSKRGHLAWMGSRQEHNALRSFVEKNDFSKAFWVGLHRQGNGPKVWAGSIRSDYFRRLPANSPPSFYAAKVDSKKIHGMKNGTKLASICRLQTSKGSESTSNVLTSMESSSWESRERVLRQQAALVKTLQKVATQTNRKQKSQMVTSEMIKRLLACPPPWDPRNGMCLFYIFQKRTWSQALDLCTALGGSLVWLDNAKEHKFVSSMIWGPTVRAYAFFWTALHLDDKKEFDWTGLSFSKYRGQQMKRSSSKYFAGRAHTTIFVGFPEHKKLSSVCRRPI